MFIMQDAQLSHDLTLLSSYSTSLLTVMSSGLLASHFQRMASQCRSLFILLGNRFAVACGVCVCGCSTLAPLYVCMKTSVCVDSNIWNTALKWKVFCFFFLKVLPGTFKLLSGKSRSLVYNRTRCFAFCFLFSKTYIWKWLVWKKAGCLQQQTGGGGTTKAQLYQRQNTMRNCSALAITLFFMFWNTWCFLISVCSCFDKVIVLLNTQWPFISTSSVSRNAVKISHEKYFHTV